MSSIQHKGVVGKDGVSPDLLCMVEVGSTAETKEARSKTSMRFQGAYSWYPFAVPDLQQAGIYTAVPRAFSQLPEFRTLVISSLAPAIAHALLPTTIIAC